MWGAYYRSNLAAGRQHVIACSSCMTKHHLCCSAFKGMPEDAAVTGRTPQQEKTQPAATSHTQAHLVAAVLAHMQQLCCSSDSALTLVLPSNL